MSRQQMPKEVPPVEKPRNSLGALPVLSLVEVLAQKPPAQPPCRTSGPPIQIKVDNCLNFYILPAGEKPQEEKKKPSESGRAQHVNVCVEERSPPPRAETPELS